MSMVLVDPATDTSSTLLPFSAGYLFNGVTTSLTAVPGGDIFFIAETLQNPGNHLYRLHPQTGTVSLVDPTNGYSEVATSHEGKVIGAAYVRDDPTSSTPWRRFFTEIDPSNNAVSQLPQPDFHTDLLDIVSFAIEAGGDILYSIDRYGGNGTTGFLQLDPHSGAVTQISAKSYDLIGTSPIQGVLGVTGQTLVSIDTSTGQATPVTTPAVYPFFAVDPDRFLYFGGLSTNTYRYDLSTGNTKQLTSAPSHSLAIAADPFSSPAAQTITLATADSSPQTTYGQGLRVTAQISVQAPRTDTPTGTVQFTIDGSASGPAVPLNAGTAHLTLPVLPAGSHQVAARYSSDSSAYAYSTSTPLTWTIAPAPLTITADNKTMPSGGTLPSLTWTINSGSVLNGDSLSGSLSTTSPSSPPGSYAITQGTLSAGCNYNLTFIPGTLTIAAAGSRVVATAITFDPSQGVDYSYTVSGAPVTDGVPVALYWSLSSSFADHLAQVQHLPPFIILQGTLPQNTPYTQHVDASFFASPPPQAAYLLLVLGHPTDSGFDESEDVHAVALPPRSGVVGPRLVPTDTLRQPYDHANLLFGTATDTFDHIDIKFNKPIDAATLSYGNDGLLSFQGPAGAVPLTLVKVTPASSDDSAYTIAFPAQTMPGAYSLVLSSAIADKAGNKMDQDQDQNQGEIPDDQVTVGISLQTSLPDSDGDGIPDAWEKNGVTLQINGQTRTLDLPGMGADPKRPDIFVEVDWVGADPQKPGSRDYRPDPNALHDVVQAFANQGINLWIDAGPQLSIAPGVVNGQRYGGTINPALAQTNTTIPYVGYVGFTDQRNGAGSTFASFDQLKTQYFDPLRSLVFHYAVFARYWNAVFNSTTGLFDHSSGRAEGLGNDLIIAEGVVPDELPQAGSFMHELGHNLGLDHGGLINKETGAGDESYNGDPSYVSVMNYHYQLGGVEGSKPFPTGYTFPNYSDGAPLNDWKNLGVTARPRQRKS